MGLGEELSKDPQRDEPKYVPHTEFDGTSGFIQTAMQREDGHPDFDAILTQFGYDPKQVQIVGNPRVSRWQRWDGEWLCAYRFHLAPAGVRMEASELEQLIKAVGARRKDKIVPDGHWMVFQAGDLQLGKRSRDGSTAEIVERYVQSVDAAKQELRALKRLGVGGVQISMPGDCIEGNQSQSGRNAWLTQQTITEQTRILRRLMLYTIDELAGCPHLYVDVVNGNHDQADRRQNYYPGDGWATECAISVADAIKLNPAAYSHVEVRVPEKWSGCMTVPVGDTVVTVVHGHQWRPNKAWDWWAKQAVHNQPPGAAQVLQNGHYHEWAIESSEHKVRVQSSTFDCGSDWYRDKHGVTAKRGGLVYLLRGGEVSRMSLV